MDRAAGILVLFGIADPSRNSAGCWPLEVSSIGYIDASVSEPLDFSSKGLAIHTHCVVSAPDNRSKLSQLGMLICEGN